jgi:hypothetical protein
MSNVACLALAVLLAAAPVSFGQTRSYGETQPFEQTDEPLHPAFADETLRDPFLIPAAISGPLDGERLDEQWDRSRQGYWFDPPSYDDVLAETDEESCAGTAVIESARRRPIIDTGVTATWLAPVDGFGVSDVDARTQFVIPVFVKGSPLRVALASGTTFINAPSTLDVPSQLYGLTAELRSFIPLKETWGIDLGAGGGVFSDLNGSAGRGFRVTGRALLMKELNPQWKLSTGILYLGRKNLLAMPVAGLIYTPREDLRVEILVPRPRVLKRVRVNGTREHWIYAGAEVFGGNTWSIQQSTGAEDTFIYKDNRVLVGYETKAPNRLAARMEAGYVFMRKVSFSNDPTTLNPGGTVMLRAGVTY